MGVGCDAGGDRFGARCDPMRSVIGSFGIPKYMDASVLTIHDPVLDDADFGVQMTLDFEVLLQRAVGDFDGKLDVGGLRMAIAITRSAHPKDVRLGSALHFRHIDPCLRSDLRHFFIARIR